MPGPGERDLLAAYDAQLRLEAEIGGADHWHRDGPLVLATWGKAGFVSYRDLDLPGPALDALIAETLQWFREETDVVEVEWKTRGHDRPEDLPERLLTHGLEPDEAETVMVGRAELLDREVALPEGIRVRRAGEGRDLPDDVARALALQEEVFGRSHDDLETRVRGLRDEPQRMGLWLAEDAAGSVVCSGRLEVVPGTDFAGLWGGGTASAWRGRGIYRALVAARARAALALGVTYLHSDCTAMSRPILERSGLVAVTTTTPYVWRR